MGDLLAFSPSTTRRRPGHVAGGEADILFFTGVRYYRLEAHVDTTVAPAVPKRRRAPRADRKPHAPLELQA